MIEYILNQQSIEALGWTLLHSLWQGAAFAVLLALLLIALRKYTAQSRYIVAAGLLSAFFVTVATTFWMQWQEANTRFEISLTQANVQQKNDVFILEDNSSDALNLGVGTINIQDIEGENLTSNKSEWLASFQDYYKRHLPLLVTFWLLGILFLQLRFLGQLAYVQRLKHYGTQLFPKAWSSKIEELEGKLRIQKKVRYLTSVRIESPMVIGWLKPAVLLPRQLLKNLSETEIYAVLAHELAHIRREDFIVNLMQTLLCNIFFFHPGVWWMSNRVDDEREHCCDDLAVTATGQATSYAKTLINVSELQLSMQGRTPSLAMALNGAGKKRERGGFTSRIRRLFMGGNGTGTFREGFATAFILCGSLIFGIAATGHTIQKQEPKPLSEIELSKNDQSNLVLPVEPIVSDVQQTETTITISKDDPISNIISTTKSNGWPEAPVEKVETRIDALVDACAEGDFDFVQTLINSGINVNGIGSEGFTPLMMATSENEIEIVEYLINQGADVNQVSMNWTALIEAADEGSFESMKLLWKAGETVQYNASNDSPSAITMAASEGNLDCLKLLLKHGADINGIGKSIPPLHIAAEEGKGEIIEYLISQEVNINKQDDNGRTALMYAASEGHEHAVKKLIDAGADLNMLDNRGNSADDYAKEEEQNDVLDYLNYDKRPEIHKLTQGGKIEKVERLVKQGGDVNARDDYGRTPLHIASAENHNIDMRVLIDLGADVNAKDNKGRTPLMYAAAEGNRASTVLLVSKLANVQLADVDGMRAYEWAVSSGNSELVNFLGLITQENTHVDINSITDNLDSNINEEELAFHIQKELQKRLHKTNQKEAQKNETFHKTNQGFHLRQYEIEEKIPELMHAAKNGTIDQCKNLLKNGVTVNSTDDTGQTPLMAAAMGNRIDIAKFLLEKGADVNKSSASGLTALHYAALENYDEMARLLLKNKAKVDVPMRYSSTDGNKSDKPLVWEYIDATPLFIAVESGNIEMISVLTEAGANPNYTVIKNEYGIKKGHETYLTLSEVFGIDEDFLKNAEINISDDNWSPYKQALQMNRPSMLALLSK